MKHKRKGGKKGDEKVKKIAEDSIEKIRNRILKNKFAMIIKAYTVIFMMIGIIFLLVSALWVCCTEYTWREFGKVLCLCIKNGSSYSALLIGVVVTFFVQIYSKERELENEEKIKIKEVGTYTLAFEGTEGKGKKEGNANMLYPEACLCVIQSKKDILDNNPIEDKKVFHKIEFLTSKDKSTILKNVMVFGEDYFEKHKNDIMNDYYEYCEKIEFSLPGLYITQPAQEKGKIENSDEKKYYFWIKIKGSGVKNIWVSAITEEGFLLFIKIKIKVEERTDSSVVRLLQQTTYYKGRHGLTELYR